VAFGEMVLGVRKNENDLFKSYARKPLEKLVNSCARFEVFKQSSHWHASTSKNPATADFIFVFVLLVDKRPRPTCST
jgi:hypothetical protein